MGANKILMAFVAVPLFAAAIVAGIGKLTDGYLFAYPARIQADVHWSGTALFDMLRAKDCWSKVEVTAAPVCTLGDPAASDKAVLWGTRSVSFDLLLRQIRKGEAHRGPRPSVDALSADRE